MNIETSSIRALVWFRRDLRDYDHAALAAALQAAAEVFCVFVFDTEILQHLPLRQDRRLQFIHSSLLELDAALRQRGGALTVVHGNPLLCIPKLAAELGVQSVFANRDYEPAAKARDLAVANALQAQGIAFVAPKDQVFFDGDEILTAAGRPYSVFTPYSRAWLRRLAAEGVRHFPCAGRLAAPIPPRAIPALSEIGFAASDTGNTAGMRAARRRWQDFQQALPNYARDRDFPARPGVSQLSVHLRYGTISIRELVAHAWQGSGAGVETWLKELIWRDFYFQILDHSPQVAERCFKPEFDQLTWDDWPQGYAAWQGGGTGYPLVDAGMRQLTQTGFMHNRLRMLTASFLCKDLGIDWRLGEQHFAAQLIDFDLAANNGGWQWAASTGCDAQPWFRIFNPITQSEKFDPDGSFIRRLVPELAAVPTPHIHAPWRMTAQEQAACGVRIGRDYPPPLVDHAAARQRTLARYGAIRNVSP